MNAYNDSLMYEYIVGHFFINNLYKKFPVFLQTYGFINTNITTLSNLKNENVINLNESNIEEGIKLSCMNPSKILLLIEYLPDSVSLTDKLKLSKRIEFHDFIENELYNVLFHIYYTLNLLKDDFTHYDLHGENVLLYEPIKGSYIEYHYHYGEQLITFKSKYIVKIIDYARCYFSNSRINSDEIYKKVCSVKECNSDPEKCGESSGYYFLLNSKKEYERFYYINSREKNHSHDLRLLSYITSSTAKFSGSPEMNQMLNKTFDNITYDSYYGTPHLPTSGLPKKINNVTDAFNNIKDSVIEQQHNLNLLSKVMYDDLTKIGDLYIYDDGRDMVFRQSRSFIEME